jgi:hypothetical protein
MHEFPGYPKHHRPLIRKMARAKLRTSPLRFRLPLTNVIQNPSVSRSMIPRVCRFLLASRRSLSLVLKNATFAVIMVITPTGVLRDRRSEPSSLLRNFLIKMPLQKRNWETTTPETNLLFRRCTYYIYIYIDTP